MEEDRLKVYKPSSGDETHYFHETSAADGIARLDSSAAIGNLADLMARGPVMFPNILAPDCFKTTPLTQPAALAPDAAESQQ